MKFSAQEEYGIRCLIRIGRYYEKGIAPNIPQISKDEQLSQHNVAKLLRVLRMGGILESERGQSGGYTLTRPPEEIPIIEVMSVLGGRLFDDEFCINHSGVASICSHTVNCSVRSLWKVIQSAVDEVISRLTLKDLLGQENELFTFLDQELGVGEKQIPGS